MVVDQNDILMLGLGLQAPWKLLDQHLDTDKSPHELQLEVGTERGTQFPCPKCQQQCSAHDYQTRQWRHLNFFQHHCYITAKVPRVKCPKHGVIQIPVPWARSGSGFTLLFEQVALSLVREMPVRAVAKHIGVTDKRLWRVVHHYVAQALDQFDLSQLKAIGLDETASKRGHNYVTIFIDMERTSMPVVFATPGKGKQTLHDFSTFLQSHKGNPDKVLEVVCDMSPAFLQGVSETLPNAEVTVDWFHIVQTFTRALDDVRKQEHRQQKLPKHVRWAVLKRWGVHNLTLNQQAALVELLDCGAHTGNAWMIKEKLSWIRQAKTPQAARWRITNFIRYAREIARIDDILEPMNKALDTLQRHAERVVRRWTSTYTNARLEGLNSLFQAARARARGYRSNHNFITMIYMIASPAGAILKST
jgi:transposase